MTKTDTDITGTEPFIWLPRKMGHLWSQTCWLNGSLLEPKTCMILLQCEIKKKKKKKSTSYHLCMNDDDANLHLVQTQFHCCHLCIIIVVQLMVPHVKEVQY